ncbi:transposase [Pseudonocardia sp. K10HN5]|uniref:Transposase n=1 Tax=Pseudonocardia acidicola TaxID=2724939 RepID=A0ABX1S9C9_9PSEU|nr:transposase [Pseudonocardia acidicola]
MDDRRLINGMLFESGPRRDLPERYRPWKALYNRFQRWSRNGRVPEPPAARLHCESEPGLGPCAGRVRFSGPRAGRITR